MSEARDALRLGVVGLGPSWRRYRRALAAESECIRLHVVYDEVHLLAAEEAERLGCGVGQSLTDVVANHDLDAVLVADAQWHGLWPVEVAVRKGLPVLCLPSVECDPEHADALLQQLARSPGEVLFASYADLCPASRRLASLLKSRLGRVQLVHIRQTSASRVPAVLDWLGWCVRLFGESPRRLTCTATDAIRAYLVEFESGRAAHIALSRIPHGEADDACAEAWTEHGSAVLRFPGHIRWTSKGRTVVERFRAISPERRLLRRFHRQVRTRNGEPRQLQELREAWRALKHG